MIALPVLAVTAAAVVQATADVERRRGRRPPDGCRRGPDPPGRRRGLPGARPRPAAGGATTGTAAASGRRTTPSPTSSGDVRAITLREGWTEVPLGRPPGERRARREVDLRDPLAAGLFDITAGRAPATPGRGRGQRRARRARGRARRHRDGRATATSRSSAPGATRPYRDTATVDVLPDALGPGLRRLRPRRRLARRRRPGDVVRRARPQPGRRSSSPPARCSPTRRRCSEMAEQMGYDTGYGDALAIVALIVTMALLEVVLLAGPAFAVERPAAGPLPGPDGRDRRHAAPGPPGGARLGDRARRRSPRSLGAVLGVGGRLGAAAARAALVGRVVRSGRRRLAHRRRGGGLRAAVGACWPPWCRRGIASRQDVVAVLAGRRGDRPPSARTPVLGVVLLGAGVALSAYGVSAVERRALVHRGRGDRRRCSG